MTIQEMTERKRELGYTNEMISERSGIPLGTVQKIFGGITKAPRRQTIVALEQLLNGKDNGDSVSGSVSTDSKTAGSSTPEKETAGNGSARNKPLKYEASGNESKKNTAVKRTNKEGRGLYDLAAEELRADRRVREAEPVYMADSRQGSYTIDDYYALPDDRRTELIDGYFYDMATPSWLHQLVIGQLFLQLEQCAESHPDCTVGLSPLDVRLDNDDYTMVQPDLLISCREWDGDIRRLNGAPDFALEVLSPSNRFHDMFRKLHKYQKAGVREYWIIDPEREKVTVYNFEQEELPGTYTFSDLVPIGISGGSCKVDFQKVREKIRRFRKH